MKQIGLRLKESGLDAVEEHNLSWVERMRLWAKIHADIHGFVSCDDIRIIAAREGDEPDHHNAYGSLFRPKEWRCVGRKPSTTASRHGAEIRVWKWQKWS